MKVQKFFDDQAEASDSDDEEYDSAEDSPGSLAEFIVDDLESKSEVRSLNSLLDSVSSDSLSMKSERKIIILIVRVLKTKVSSAKSKESVGVL